MIFKPGSIKHLVFNCISVQLLILISIFLPFFFQLSTEALAADEEEEDEMDEVLDLAKPSLPRLRVDLVTAKKRKILQQIKTVKYMTENTMRTNILLRMSIKYVLAAEFEMIL